MSAKKVIWGDNSCPGCQMAKKYLADELRSGEFDFVELDSAEGKKIEEEFPDLMEIPQCFVRKDGGGHELCDLEDEIEKAMKRKGKK